MWMVWIFFGYRRARACLCRLRGARHSCGHRGTTWHGHCLLGIPAWPHDFRKLLPIARPTDSRKAAALSRRAIARHAADDLPGRPSAADFDRHKGPSTPMGCDLSAGVLGTLKILLGRGSVPAAPRGLHFDADPTYLQDLAPRRYESSDPATHARYSPATVGLRSRSFRPRITSMTPPHIERILDLARWAPSGDNTQPWRFEVVDDRHFVIYGRDTREWCVYDLNGRASQLAIGALLETIALAASGEGFSARFDRRPGVPRLRQSSM